MEFVIVASLAFFGNQMSKTGKTPRYKREKIEKENAVNKYPFSKKPLSDKFKEKILEPGYNWKPHYNRIGGMQNKGGAEVMEGFIPREGKEEVKSFGDIERQNINGMPLQTIEQRGDELNTYSGALSVGSSKQSEKLDQIKVGPGLNTPDSVATGGYQQFYRILPKDLSTKETFGGRLLLGKGIENKQTLNSEVQINSRNPESKAYDRETSKGRASVLGTISKTQFVNSETNRGNKGGSLGGAHAIHGNTVSVVSTRNKDSTQTGVEGTIAGTQGPKPYNIDTYDDTSTMRDNEAEGPIVAYNYNSGNMIHSTIPAPVTVKQTTETNKTMGGPVKGPLGTKSTNVSEQGHTLREDTRSFTPGAGRMNILQDATDIIRNVELKEDSNYDATGNPYSMNAGRFKDQTGEIELNEETKQKSLDFKLLTSQLNTNPYNRSII